MVADNIERAEIILEDIPFGVTNIKIRRFSQDYRTYPFHGIEYFAVFIDDFFCIGFFWILFGSSNVLFPFPLLHTVGVAS